MNKIISLLVMLSAALGAWAQGGSGVGYDPTNPPDPQASYRLKLESSPARGGYLSPSDGQICMGGESVWIEANARIGYTFREWREGDKVVSISPSFYYEMPYSNVTLTAWFDKEEYNPESPEDPYLTGYTHRVNIYNTPSGGGYNNNSNFLMREGDKTTIYAYPHSGFKFSCWKQDGKIISVSQELEIKMGKENLEYTAQYVYDPSDPGDPLPNLWNPATGEMIIDHFEPGNLWNAISSILGDDDSGKVTTLTVIGRMDNYDMGCVRNLPQLTDADFSRTSGCTYVPSWIFENCSALTKVSLPASIERIEWCAFYGCGNLSELNVLASMPPTIDSGDTFQGVPETMVVKVYSSSLDLYEEADYWKNYKIMTLDEDSTALTVNLPEDGADGRYRNASLVLTNVSTGQTQRLIVTGTRTKYIFGNLIPDMKYVLTVISPNGAEIGSEPEFEMPKAGTTITLSSLLQMQDVSLRLLTPEGTDVADQANITWKDATQKTIGNGPTVAGLLPGNKVSYEIALPRELGLQYKNVEPGSWTVAEKANTVTVNLKAHAKAQMKGTLTDAETGDPISGAYVSVAQQLNGLHDYSATAATGADGSYIVEIYDATGTLTLGSPDHTEITAAFADAIEASISGTTALAPLSGTEITLSVLSRDNIAQGSAATDFAPYADAKSAAYSVRNVTKKSNPEYRLRYPVMTLLDLADEGDVVEITVTPANGNIKASSARVTIKDGKASTEIKLTTNGDLRMTYGESEAEEVLALIYGEDGKLAKTATYTDGKASFTGLPAGKYTTVTMESSTLIGIPGAIDELHASKLTSGSDYIEKATEVSDGYISEVNMATVPKLDETKFFYTAGTTSIGVNKTSVTVGATVTVRSKVEFRPEHEGKIERVRIIFNIPEGCEYVDNSLIVPGQGSSDTWIEEGKISVDVAVKDAKPRFCIIPRQGGDFRPSAAIEFEIDGETIRQPIGSALLTAGDFTLSVPDRTYKTHIIARGGTTALSEVKVYDNDVPVGTTRSLTNGSWRLGFDLHNPGDKSAHTIRAEITTPEGVKYRTAASTTIYDKDWAELTDIMMIYGGTTVDLNHVEATTTPASYTYEEGNNMFTFKTSFRDDNAAKVKQFYFVILLSDGTYRKMEGVFMPSTSTWTCAIGFADINRLPVNVKAYYTESEEEGALPAWKAEAETAFRCPDVIPVIDPSGYVYEAVASNRIPGVEATIFYKEYTEDMYGDVHEQMIKWDAEAYAQENPLFTNEDGEYQWDVPQGEWMVRFEKEGYETTQTDWLPVPPPQLDVNVGMMQMVPPQVKEAHAYDQSVEIEFDKYMQPAHLNTSSIVVTDGGKKAEGSITLLDAEETDGATYAKMVRFEAYEPFSGNSINLLVSTQATSYAGIRMEQAFEQEFNVEPSITAINAAEEARCYMDSEGKIAVEVLPAESAAGKTLIVKAGSSIVKIDESVTLDKEGKAVVPFVGQLPGVVDIAISVEGSSLAPAVTRLTLTPAPIPAEDITLGEEIKEGVMGTVYNFNATVLPEETTYKTVVWSSSDESIATVDENGNVTITGVGDVTITATCGDAATTQAIRCYPQTGDANWNGEITISDAVDITNYVVKKKRAPEGWDEDEWTEFYTAGANANGSEDGTITFADASATVRIALAQPVAASTQRRIPASEESAKTTDALVMGHAIENRGMISVPVKLNATNDYVALQADILLPDGMEIEVKKGSMVADTHSLETMMVEDNRLRIALYNLNGKAIAREDSPVLEISVLRGSDIESLTISNILAADSDAKEYRLGLTAESTTGVEGVATESVRIVKTADGVEIYGAEGKDVEICTLDGQTVRSFTARDAVETVNLSAGLYIVRVGGRTLKVIM